MNRDLNKFLTELINLLISKNGPTIVVEIKSHVEFTVKESSTGGSLTITIKDNEGSLTAIVKSMCLDMTITDLNEEFLVRVIEAYYSGQ